MDVYGLVTDVIISGNNQVGASASQFINIIMKIIQPFIFKSLPDVACCTRWHVNTHYRNIAKISSNHPSLEIIFGNSTTIFNVVRFIFGDDGSTAISLLLSRKPEVFITQIIKGFEVNRKSVPQGKSGKLG